MQDGNKSTKKPRIRELTKHTGNPKDTLIILSISVFAIIIAFAWRDTVEQAFEEYYPNDTSQLKAQLIYAIGVTILAVIIIFWISRIG